MEIFKEIIGYENYLVSNKGRVKSKSRMIRYTHSVTGCEHFRLSEEKFLKEHISSHGYKFFQLNKNKKMKNVTAHRLVAMAFIDNPMMHNVVNHIDGNKLNNCVENLEWCTDEYNHQHAAKIGLTAKGSEIGTSKLTERCVNAIKYFLNLGFSHTDLGIAFNVSRSAISLIAEGKTWSHIDFALTGEELNYQPKGKV